MLNRRTIFAAILMALCGLGGPVWAQSSTPMITLDANANGGTTRIAQGTMFAIALPENPSTGYTWKLQPLGVPAVGLIGERFVPASGEGQPGEGGTRVMTFATLSPGTAVIDLTLRRLGDETSPPTQTFQVTITVASDADGG